ncbi:MAG: hypothetical protein WEC75_05910 [Dehalococcoidia bacterium]
MSVRAITQTDDGRELVPASDGEWRDWVSASATRAFLLDDPLLDWLELYGEAHGFARDDALPGYDERTDFMRLLFRQGHLFEEAVMRHLASQWPVVRIAQERADSRSLAKAQETFDAMASGAEMIAQGVLWNAETRTYGMPDLLVRSDVLAALFPDCMTLDEVRTGARGLGLGDWHYRVVDIKFSTLHLTARTAHASNEHLKYMGQVWLYNEALGRIQGFVPPAAFLLGRRWQQGESERGTGCMERLAPVGRDHNIRNKGDLRDLAGAAVAWVRRVRREGEGWRTLPEPSVDELRPDMTNQEDGPWHEAKRRIAEATEDLTQLWYVGVAGRRAANARGITRWTDPACTAAAMKVTGASRPVILDEILAVNHSVDGPPVRPERVRTAEDRWRAPAPAEFYVDFETVTDLADDFSRIPEIGGQQLIFIIGCGHLEDGVWRFETFVVDHLTEPDEARMIDEWCAHMASVRERLAPGADPLVIHWSHAEPVNFELAYNAARKRHPEKDWPDMNWFDFLMRVVRQEPVVVRGALAFGLKVIARAMRSHGLIETEWGDGPADGLGAMVGAWWCEEEAGRTSVRLPEIDLMREIIAYNEVDCRVMMEIVRYLRASH